MRLLFFLRFLPNEAARGAPPPPWFDNLLHHILEHNQSVINLLGPLSEPFCHQPPKYIRVSLYDYRFTYGHEQDLTTLTDTISSNNIGKTWYRKFVKVYAIACGKNK